MTISIDIQELEGMRKLVTQMFDDEGNLIGDRIPECVAKDAAELETKRFLRSVVIYEGFQKTVESPMYESEDSQTKFSVLAGLLSEVGTSILYKAREP